jgi:hypothetical protein
VEQDPNDSVWVWIAGGAVLLVILGAAAFWLFGF